MAKAGHSVFLAKLIPNCQEPILGVPIPALRKLAKEIIKEGKARDFLQAKVSSFEDKMLKILIFGNLKIDFLSQLSLAENLIEAITNWSLCDTFCTEFKSIKNNRAEAWSFLAPYWKSTQTYHLRVAIVISLFYFIQEDYLELIFKKFREITHEDYYVKMAVAWALSMCFVKFPSETLTYLKSTKLDPFIYKKTLQKITESLQVDSKTKDMIRSLKQLAR